MTEITRKLAAPEQDVLAAIAQFVQSKFPKVKIETQGNSVMTERKVLWQTQKASFQVQEGQLTASGNAHDSDKIIYKTLESIESMLDDLGWNEAARTHGTKSVAKGHLFKGQVLDALEPTERIVVATQGVCDGKVTLLTVTDKRFLVISGEIFGLDKESQTISLDKVSSISEKTGLNLGSIRISTSNDEIEIEKVVAKEAKAVVSAARSAINQLSSSPASPNMTSGVGVDDLKKLSDLHAAGILTDEEFAAAKAKALGL